MRPMAFSRKCNFLLANQAASVLKVLEREIGRLGVGMTDSFQHAGL